MISSATSFEITPLEKLTKDVKDAAKTLGRREARYLVDAYYTMQKNRMRAGRQAATLLKFGEPNLLVTWQSQQDEFLEKNIKSALAVYSANSRIGQWAESICGIGPVISAGLLANIDIHKCKTAGQLQRFAGIDPTVQWLGAEKSAKLVQKAYSSLEDPSIDDVIMWISRYLEETGLKYTPEYIRRRALTTEKGETVTRITRKSLTSGLARRPWNASLKRLCWIIGESFVKVSTNDKDYYGKVWRQRSEYETLKNERLEYKDQAEKSLREKNFDTDTDAYKAYIQGKLPKARIHERAKRYAVKLFLNHWHWVAYEITFNERPPKPYVIEHLGHAHLLSPPNWTSIVGSDSH